MEGSASPADRSEPESRVRLAELLAVLSLGTDLGMGQPMEHVLRQCLISLRLAQAMGLDAADREVVFYAALLAWVGCHVDAYEQARWFGDDLALKSDFRRVDFGSAAAGPLFMLRHLGAGRPASERVKLGAGFAGLQWILDAYVEPYDSAACNDCANFSGTSRVIRGGSFSSPANDLRPARRINNAPDGRGVNLGFRCARLP